MNQKIFFPQLATMLAQRSGRTKRVCEDFLREFFSLLSQTLEEGDSVKIKGFGTFRVQRVESRRSVDVTTGETIEIPIHARVTFTPAKEIADKINSPFEAFEAVELSDDFENDSDETEVSTSIEVSAEDNQSAEASTESQSDVVPGDIRSESPATIADENATPTIIITEEIETSATENPDFAEASPDSYSIDESDEDGGIESEQDRVITPVGNEIIEEINNPEDTIVPEDTEIFEEEEINNLKEEEDTDIQKEEDSYDSEGKGGNEPEEEEPNKDTDSEEKRIVRKSRFGTGFFIGFACCLLLCVAGFGLFLYFGNMTKEKPGQPDQTATSAEAEVKRVAEAVDQELSDSLMAAKVATQPSDKAVVYDTISRTRFLTTMAKEHYGNFNLWPYIYEENKSFLGHPDRIKPGTPVVVPPLSKYGVAPSSAADIEKARKMGLEIYSRYR